MPGKLCRQTWQAVIARECCFNIYGDATACRAHPVLSATRRRRYAARHSAVHQVNQTTPGTVMPVCRRTILFTGPHLIARGRFPRRHRNDDRRPACLAIAQQDAEQSSPSTSTTAEKADERLSASVHGYRYPQAASRPARDHQRDSTQIRRRRSSRTTSASCPTRMSPNRLARVSGVQVGTRHGRRRVNISIRGLRQGRHPL